VTKARACKRPLWEFEFQWTPESSGSDYRGENPLDWKKKLYHWKDIKTHMSKMGLHDPFGHLKQKLWPKERLGVKLTVWLPTIKSQESTQFPCVQVACNIPLESSQQGLQLFFRPHLNRRYAHKVMGPQSCKSPNFGTKCHLHVGLVERRRVYYKGGGGAFLQVQAVVSLVSSRLPVVHLSTKSALTMH